MVLHQCMHLGTLGVSDSCLKVPGITYCFHFSYSFAASAYLEITEDDGSSSWVLSTHVGDLGGLLALASSRLG